MKNLKISEDTHKLFKEYCKNNHLKMNEYVDSWISSANWLTEGNLGQVARAVQLWCIQDHRVATNDLVIEDYVHRLKIASNKPLTKNEKKKFLYWFFDQLCDDVA